MKPDWMKVCSGINCDVCKSRKNKGSGDCLKFNQTKKETKKENTMSKIEGFPTSNELRKVRINGHEDEYLCTINEDGSLHNAYSCEEKAEVGDFKKYIRALNIGKVEDVIVSPKLSCTIKTLTKDEKITYDTLLARMNEAIIYAGSYWENEVFTKITTGKYQTWEDRD